jgi:L-alanine-DL-glutamate epimerase-like enolase superfamily enzyme
LDLARLARRRQVEVVITDSLESAIGRTGALHLAAALGRGAPACGMAGLEHLKTDVARMPHALEGFIELPKGVGLGVVPEAHG